MPKPITGSVCASLLVLALSACTPEASENQSSNAAAPANSAAPAEGNEAAAAPAPAERSPLVLEGAGLGIPDASPPRILSFDTPKAATIDAVTKALGRPPTAVGENEECGGGGLEFAEWKDEITLYFESGNFAGWDNDGKLKTTEGIGIGSSRADLSLLDSIEVEESTLGTEFRAGGLGGLLQSKAPGAKITALWGGVICAFR